MIDIPSILEASALVFTIEVLMWTIIGVTIGVGVGAIPGLSPAPAIALLLPLTFALSLPAALGLLIGVYKGGVFGGSIPAISFATPGTAESGATVLDGYKLTQQGKGRKALQLALYASVTGDFFAALATILLAPSLAIIALNFGPSERLWLMVLAIALLGALSGEHFAKGLLSASIGLFIATIGSDPVSLVARNTFGQWWLADGIKLIPLIIGVFAIAVMLERAGMLLFQKAKQTAERVEGARAEDAGNLTFSEYRKCFKEMTIGTTVGTFVGILPGLGSTVAAFLSYGIAKKASPSKNIGSGRLEGIAAAESGNNATAGPTLVPLLAFGIPGSAIAAMIGGALAIQGVQVGPRMFEIAPVAVYALFIILLVANIFNLFVGRIFTGFYARLGTLPEAILIPTILIMAMAGAYAYKNNPYDVWLALLFGGAGVFLRAFSIPPAPLIVTFILAPLAEESLRRTLLINRGDWMEAVFGSPIAVGIATVGLILTVALAWARPGRKFQKSVPTTEQLAGDNAANSNTIKGGQ